MSYQDVKRHAEDKEGWSLDERPISNRYWLCMYIVNHILRKYSLVYFISYWNANVQIHYDNTYYNKITISYSTNKIHLF